MPEPQQKSLCSSYEFIYQQTCTRVTPLLREPSDHLAEKWTELEWQAMWYSGAFGTAFPDMAPLKIATECYMWSLVQNCGLVNMGESPVIVSLVDQVLDGTRRIVRVPVHPAQAGVQDADVEAAGNRRRICGN